MSRNRLVLRTLFDSHGHKITKLADGLVAPLILMVGMDPMAEDMQI